MRKMKNKFRQFADRFGRKVEIDTFESFLMQMNSSGELTFKGCTNVMHCTENKICLNCSYGIVNIIGMQLNVPRYSSDETSVSGTIAELHFIWRD